MRTLRPRGRDGLLQPILQGDGSHQLVYAVAHERRTLMKQLFIALGLVSLAATGACAAEVKAPEAVVAVPVVTEKVVVPQPPVVKEVVVAQPPVVEKVIVPQAPVVVEQVKMAKPKVVEVVVKKPVVKETIVVH